MNLKLILKHYDYFPHGNCDCLPKVGSEDFDIRIFHNEDVISEISEADVVVGLTPIQGQKYGYALANGTIGMYNGTSRVWRVKSKHSLCAISGFDLDGDGVPELLSGWSNGRVRTASCIPVTELLGFFFSGDLLLEL